MNKKLMMGAAALLVAGVAQAAIITDTSVTGINDASEIVKPTDDATVLMALNVGGTVADTINGITFVADTFVDSVGGTGYTVTSGIGTEGSGALPAAVFSTTTINLGDTGSVTGDTITGLNTDSLYVFEVYFSDAHNVRATDVQYSIGGTSGSVAMSQADDALHRVRIEVNTEDSTSFDWSIGDGFHAKVSGLAVYAVPEPATLGLIAAFGGGILFIRRNFKG